MLISTRLLAGTLATLALAACGGDDTPPAALDGGPSSAGFTLSLAPVSLSLAPGSESTVAVRIERDLDLEGQVELVAVAVPEGLAVSFADPRPTGGEAMATVRVSADAAPGVRGLWIRGESGRGRQAAALEVAVLDRRVNGSVVDLRGLPVADAEVRIGEGTSTTDAEGHFTITDVEPPYELTVTRTGAAGLEVHHFVGLERMDPTLPLASLLQPLPRRATVQGTLSGGGGFPSAFDTVTFVVVAADGGGGSIVLPPGEGPAFGPIEVTWAGAATTNATVHALQWRMDGARLPLEYTGYGSQPIALVEGDALDEALALEPVETTFVTAQPTWPSDHRPTRATLHGRFGDRVSIPLAIDGALEASVTYAVPRGAELGLQLGAAVGEATSTIYSLLAPGEVISPALPAAPRLAVPVDGATGVVPETSFEWTAYDRSVQVLTASTPSGPSFAIYTADARASLEGTGVALSSGAPYSWGVTAVGPYESLDELVDPDGGIPAFGQGRDARLGRTGIRSFTAAP